MKNTVFWDVTPFSLVDVYLYFYSSFLEMKIVACIILVACIAFFSTLNMDAVFSSETSVDLY
jgi:hypothetical protein